MKTGLTPIACMWFAAMPGVSFTQNVAFNSTIRFGSTNVEYISSGDVDGSGNEYVIGNFQHTMVLGNITLTPSSLDKDVFIAKRSSTGDWVWAYRIQGSNIDVSGGLAVDGEDHLLVSMIVGSPTVIYRGTTINMGTNNFLFMRLDTAGVLDWHAGAQGLVNDPTMRLVPDGSGGLYATGMANDWGTLIFGNDTLAALGDFSGFLAHLDGSGNWDWAKAFWSLWEMRFNDLDVDATGHVILTGTYAGYSVFLGDTTIYGYNDPEPYNVVGPFIISYDADGTRNWLTTSDNTYPGMTWVYSVVPRSNGELVVFLQPYAGIHLGALTVDSASYYLARIDADGHWIDLHDLGTGAWQSLDAIGLSDDLFAVTGVFNSTLIWGPDTLSTSMITSNVFAGVCDASGHWLGAVGGIDSAYVIGRVIRQTTDTSLVVFGFFGETCVFGADTLVSAGDWDCFISRITFTDAGVGVHELAPSQVGLVVYPDPFIDMLHIRLPSETAEPLRIFDGSGRLLSERTVHASSLDLDLGSLPQGLYVLRVGGYAARVVKDK